MDVIRPYLSLPEDAIYRLNTYAALVRDWNTRINLVSRKDIDSFDVHHLLPVLAVTKWKCWQDFDSVLDVGSGAGIPGIPLAILYPKTRFTLIDSIGKKIKALKQIVAALGLLNVETIQVRVEMLEESYDAVIGRAVMDFEKFSKLVMKNVNRKVKNGGIFYWTGGDLFNTGAECFDLASVFSGKYCEGKKILYIPTEMVKYLY